MILLFKAKSRVAWQLHTHTHRAFLHYQEINKSRCRTHTHTHTVREVSTCKLYNLSNRIKMLLRSSAAVCPLLCAHRSKLEVDWTVSGKKTAAVEQKFRLQSHYSCCCCCCCRADCVWHKRAARARVFSWLGFVNTVCGLSVLIGLSIATHSRSRLLRSSFAVKYTHPVIKPHTQRKERTNGDDWHQVRLASQAIIHTVLPAVCCQPDLLRSLRDARACAMLLFFFLPLRLLSTTTTVQYRRIGDAGCVYDRRVCAHDDKSQPKKIENKNY